MYYLGAGVLFLLYFATNSIAKVILRLRDGEVLRRDLAAPTGGLAEAYRTVDAWARERGFQAAGLTMLLAYPELAESPGVERFREYMAAWVDREQQRMLVIQHFRGKTFYHFITLYQRQGQEGTLMVNTTNQPNEFFMPQPPGHYVQAFPGKTLDELLVRHEQAERWFEAQTNGQRLVAKRPLDELERISRERAAYVTGLPLWKPRLLWWQLVKGLSLNKPVQQLYG
ncbi:hypothetical protein [Oceanithermus sp.]